MSAPPEDRPAPGPDSTFRLFIYGTLRTNGPAAHLLDGSKRVCEATVEGTLYDLGAYPALMLYGTSRVEGEVWSCPVPLLAQLDEYERVEHGLFRRVAVIASGIPCWTYVAGPALAPQLTTDRRVAGRWEPDGA